MTIAAIGSALIYTVFLWWFSTGAVLWLDRRPRDTYRLSLTGASVVAVLAVGGLVATLRSASATGAIIAFTCALAVWGWHEMSFLMGFVTGPRVEPCPLGAKGWRRFTLAASTLIHHEIALAVTAAAMIAISWGQPNKVGSWTFLILFASRLSAKLNLFFGVPNFSAELFPDHLGHLTSYLRKGPVNALFPISVVAGGTVVGLTAWRALSPEAGPFEVTGFALLFALTALALIEHAFMVLPLPDAALWRWALPASEKKREPVPLDL